MTDLFITILDRSLSASWVVLAVLTARLVLKKAPRWLVCGLWALVALRLLCPFSLESTLSLVPRQTVVQEATQELLDDYVGPTKMYYDITPEYETAREAGLPAYPAGEEQHSYVVTGETPVTPPTTLGDVLPSLACRIWLLGITALLSYAAISYGRIAGKVRVSIHLGNGVYLCDDIDTPFLLGLFRPRIYLPSALDPKDVSHVLAHEQAHLKRRDHWWKPLGFVLLAVHWFNPLLWLAYILLCRDIELACDERVIRDMKAVEKKAYTEALLTCSVNRRMIVACPLAFGEVSVKERVTSILNYHKPGFWVLMAGILTIAFIGVGFLTNQPKADPQEPFHKGLWAAEVIYNENGEALYEAPSDLLEPLWLSDSTSSTSFAPYCRFEQTSLTEENFDALFTEDGTWYHKSAKKLRSQTENAWVLHENSYNGISHSFYYLLQLRNGDLYLTSGRWWGAELRPGTTAINCVLRLEDATVLSPFADGETPFVYTRTIGCQYITGHAWHPLTLAQEDINIDDYQIYIPTLTTILHCVPEDAFKLESPIQNVEYSIGLDVSNSEQFDVQLRYGDGKVEMVFDESCTWSFADTGDKLWHIDYDGLKNFFYQYSLSFTLPAYLQEPIDLHNWRSSVDARDLERVSVYMVVPLRHNYGYFMSQRRVEELLTQLKKLPNAAFVPTDFHADAFEQEEAGLISLQWHYPNSSDDAHSIRAEILYLDGHVYFYFQKNKDSTPLQVWEILDKDFMESLNARFDPALPHDFHISEAATGTISVAHGYGSIQLNTYEYMEYEIIGYSDNETPFGIRMRPKMMAEGSISLLYYPGGFTPDPGWTENAGGSIGDHSVIWYGTEEQHTHYQWPAWYFTDLPGDYVVISEGLEVWAEEYHWDHSAIFEGMELAGDYLTKTEILELARTLLPDSQAGSLYAQVDGERRAADVSFDSRTGTWNIAARATGKKESVLLVTMDVYGNVIDNFLNTR